MIRNKEWQIKDDALIKVLQDEICLADDMSKHIEEIYDRQLRMTPYRLLCLGYLITGRNNLDSSQKLIEANLVHQVHYICRNSFELVITLYFIENFKNHERDSWVKRYYDYSAVIQHKAKKIMYKHAATLEPITTPEKDAEIEAKYKEFEKKYKPTTDKKINTNTWSGIDNRAMINLITDQDTKDRLMMLYDTIVKGNNLFLHPTQHSMQEEIVSFFSKKVDYKQRYAMLYGLVTAMKMIFEVCLKKFSKGRIEFSRRLKLIDSGIIATIDEPS